jgi:hypothetical protein
LNRICASGECQGTGRDSHQAEENHTQVTGLCKNVDLIVDLIPVRLGPRWNGHQRKINGLYCFELRPTASNALEVLVFELV